MEVIGPDGPRTVYVVDDDPALVRALGRALAAIGYQVVGATGDARVALAQIPEAAPDVVVMDIDLRQALTGIDVALRLRASCDVPVLLLTAVDDPELGPLLDHDGVVGYLSKPFSLTTLRTTIELVRVQHQARARLRELDRRYHELQSTSLAASRAKNDFLAHMSHELRTPLNAVLGLSEALIEHTFGPLNDAQARTLATIHDSGRHLLELINDVLDIARVESGNLPIESEHVSLRPLIDESTALVYGQLTLKGQRLVIELEPGLPPVDVDKRRIKQVLLNLLGNAIKFSPPGAVVTLRAANHPEVRQVTLTVADTGPGIAAADRQRIFEPFVTLDPSTAREHAGAGLGLSLVKRIVELHQGQVRIDNEPGGGSRFTVTLPVSSAYAGAPPVPPPARPAPRGTPPPDAAAPVVLLAEDNATNVTTVRGYLEVRGYQVRVVRDGLAAIDAAAAADVAVVLMDIQLAGLDGLEATRRIRAGGTGKPIIALTAHAMAGDAERCLAAGASAYLAKPVRLRELTDTIERLIDAGAEPRP